MYFFWKDGKFWTVAVDTLVGLTLYFVGKYGSSNLLEDLKIVWAALQPIVVIIIASLFQLQYMAYEKGKSISAFKL